MSMIMESQTLPNIEGKVMEFTVDIQDAQFNHEGWYYLLITLHNSFVKDYSGVRMMKSDSGVWESRHVVQTDFTRQEETSPLSFFHDKRFAFRFPKGFLKNDRNHEVYLLVEAFTTADTTQGKGRKMGEGKFAIYPRPNAPRMKLYAEPGEDYYHYTDVMSLLRTHSTDSIQMHCGRIRSTYSICEVIPPKPKTPPPPTPPLSTQRKRLTPVPSPVPPISSPKDSPVITGRTSKPADNVRPVVKPPTPASSWGDNLSLDLNLPKSPPLPPAADGRKLPESPLADSDRHTFSTDKAYRHVASKGNEQIDVILHGASSLPMTPDGQVPQPYGVVKTQKEDDANKRSGAVTHASLRPTHSPSWEEMVTMRIDENTSKDDVLVVNVGDAQTQKCLVNYKVPVSYLKPFHQYHLELNMPARGIPAGVKTYATITRKLPRLPRDPSSPNYLALEVLLMSVQKPIKSALGPLIAVARIVPDYYNYKSDNLLSHPRNAGVVMQSITFPSAHPTNFAVTERSQHGHPQISLPGRPEGQPTWNHPYLFVEERDKATLFTPAAALVIEYYVASTAMSDLFWRMQSPVAFSAVLMDEEMYKHLISDRYKTGARIDGVPMQGSEMSTIDGKRPTVGVILRLVTTEVPDSMVSASNLEDIPLLDLYPSSDVPDYYRADSPEILRVDAPAGQAPADTQLKRSRIESPLSPPHTPKTPPSAPHRLQREREREPNPGQYVLHKIRKRPISFYMGTTESLQKRPIKDGEMPPFNAMESALPEYQYIFQPGDDARAPRTPTRVARPGPSKVPDGDELDKNSFVLLDHQSKELGNYRDAVHKMGQDIIVLRSQVRDLEGVNSHLRLDLANYNDSSKLMLDTTELNGLSKPEVLSRYAALKQTLSTQTSTLKTYKDRLQKTQNELIKKNDREKDFLQLQKAHASLQVLVQKLQDRLKKMKKLEEACKRQENVISEMEKVLAAHHRSKSRGQKGPDPNAALLAENSRLREQIEDLRSQLRAAGGNSGDDMERMELYLALEKAEARIAALERQLAENSRTWGKERANLDLKLNEAEHGFGRSAGMVLHDYPVFNDITAGKSKRLSPVYR